MDYVESYKELEVYKSARLLSKKIFEVSRNFPREEMYSLTDQVRRSSRSIGAQIAEAWGKRKYEKHFVSKLTDADAEQQETQHWIETALDCSYIMADESRELLAMCASIGKMLHSMMNKSHLFCANEEDITYERTAENRLPNTDY